MAANRLSLAVAVKDLAGGKSECSHLISNPSAPLDHLRYRAFVHAPARLPDGIHNSEVTL